MVQYPRAWSIEGYLTYCYHSRYWTLMQGSVIVSVSPTGSASRTQYPFRFCCQRQTRESESHRSSAIWMINIDMSLWTHMRARKSLQMKGYTPTKKPWSDTIFLRSSTPWWQTENSWKHLKFLTNLLYYSIYWRSNIDYPIFIVFCYWIQQKGVTRWQMNTWSRS